MANFVEKGFQRDSITMMTRATRETWNQPNSTGEKACNLAHTRVRVQRVLHVLPRMLRGRSHRAGPQPTNTNHTAVVRTQSKVVQIPHALSRQLGLSRLVRCHLRRSPSARNLLSCILQVTRSKRIGWRRRVQVKVKSCKSCTHKVIKIF